MVRPDRLAGGDGEALALVHGQGAPGAAGAEPVDAPGLEMADHLRRWNHHAVHVVQRMQTDARQPVVQPERVGTGGKGLRQGQACTILAPMPEQCLRTGHASLLQRFGKIDRLAVLAQSHEHRHLACRAAAEAELDAVDQPVQALRGIQLAAEQLVAQGGPGRLAPEIEREAVGLGEALGGGHDQRGRIGQRHETDVQGALFPVRRNRRPRPGCVSLCLSSPPRVREGGAGRPVFQCAGAVVGALFHSCHSKRYARRRGGFRRARKSPARGGACSTRRWIRPGRPGSWRSQPLRGTRRSGRS